MNRLFRAVFAFLCLIVPLQHFGQSGMIIYDGTSGIVGTSVRHDTVRIRAIVPNSPADKADIHFRDQLIQINGHQVSGNGTSDLLVDELLSGSAGDSVSLLLRRGLRDSLFFITLQYDLYLNELNYNQFEYLVDSVEKWNIRDVISDSLITGFSDPIKTKCLVYSVEPGSPAEQKGILPGDQLISLTAEMQNGESEIGMDKLHNVTQDTSISILRDSSLIHLDLNPSREGTLNGVQSQYHHDFEHKCIWIRITTTNRINKNRSYLFNFPELRGSDSVNFYEILPSGEIIERKAGVSLPKENRDFIYKNWTAVRVLLVSGAEQTWYARLRSEEGVESSSVTLIAQETIVNHDRLERMILSAFYGMMLIISLYYLILFFTSRHVRFLYFSLYILSFGFLLFTLEGFPGEYTWKHPELYKMITSSYDFILFSVVSIFFLLFGNAYLELKRSLKSWNISVWVLIGIILFSITLFTILNIFPETKDGDLKFIVFWIYFISGMLIPMFILIIPAIMRIREGSGPAWFFLVSNVFLAISIFLSYNNTSIRFTAYSVYRPEFATMMLIIAVYLAAVIQFLLFSVGLAQKMKIDEQEKKLAQERVIVQLRENEKLKDKVTRELEQKVVERTHEIMEQKEEIEAQRDEIGGQRDQLTDSINYAERIQSAVMPHLEYMNAVMPEHFVLFKPRDIVSGDFYWIREIGHHLVVAAADCTGHGVPGAFMSMLGIAFLNEQVGKNQVEAPGRILNRLRNKMKETMAQEGKPHEQQDGMDMALAIIDTAGQKLQFAGAYNPLYMISGKQQSVDKQLEQYLSMEGDEYQLFELKGDRQPIAIHTIEADFETRTIPLQKGDTIYLFSDGFVDQKCGPRRKKFLSKNFKKLLLEIQDLSMAEQKSYLENTLDSWRDGFEQIDDILVMGIRI